MPNTLINTVYVGGSTITLAFNPNKTVEYGKLPVTYSIRLPYVAGSENLFENGRVHIASDLYVLPRETDADTMAEATRALFSFLSASAESGSNGENSDLFPEDVRLWAEQNSDEISLLSLEDEEV